MRFYASKCHDRLNGMDFRLEDDTEYLMLNPKYPVTLSRPVRYMLDSGAFQDVRAESRLTYQGALDRQMGFERRVGQRADRIVSYDRLVDEQKTPTGGQFKARVDEDTGAEYVEDTIKAAEFLASRRESLEGRTLVLSCQGTTVGQYLGCVSSVMDVAEPGDTIGIGGFCIMSRRKEYQEQYRDIMGAAVPAIAGGGGQKHPRVRHGDGTLACMDGRVMPEARGHGELRHVVLRGQCDHGEALRPRRRSPGPDMGQGRQVHGVPPVRVRADEHAHDDEVLGGIRWVGGQAGRSTGGSAARSAAVSRTRRDGWSRARMSRYAR